ncbi:MAG: metallophosphoesterase [Elusimicrobiota bacterium]
MKTTLLLLLAAAVAAPASASAETDPRTLSGIFDGSGEKASLDAFEPAVAPPAPEGAPLEPPPELTDARDRWGNQAQSALLKSLHPESNESFTFAVIGDVEGGRFPWQRWWSPGKDAFLRQLRAIHAQSPDLIVQLGDFVSKGTAENYGAYLRLIGEEVSLPMFHVIGNHDRSRPNGEADKSLYRALFGEGDYSFDHNGWRFVAVDSSDSRLGSAQLAWLDRELETPLRKVVFTHVVPAFLEGRLQSTGPADISAQFRGSGFFKEGSERFGEIMSERAVERVYMGHIHAFGSAVHKGVRYVLTAGGGSPLYPLPPDYPKRKKAHYLIIEAGPDGLKETVHELDGTSFSLPPDRGLLPAD